MPRKTIDQIKAEQREALEKIKNMRLSDVCDQLGGELEKVSNEERWLFGSKGARTHRIQVDDQTGLWRCAASDGAIKGGKNAVNLVMFIHDCDFKQAVTTLEGKSSQISLSPARSQTAPTTKVEAPRFLEMPFRCDASSSWPAARRFLIEKRGLSPEIIDPEHEKGNLYVSRSGSKGQFMNIVMPMRDANGDVCGAEIKGTVRGPNGYYTGLAKGSRKADSAFHVGADPSKAERALFVESGIDAMAALQFFEAMKIDVRFTAISSAGEGTGFERIEKLLPADCEKWACHDNDVAGEKLAEKMSDRTDIRYPSPVGKDWGDWAIHNYQEQKKCLSAEYCR